MNLRNQMLHNRYVVSNEMRSLLIKEVGHCENCEYAEFLEILELAHIIHGHEPEKIRRDNVFLLCPTCHRAFDRGLIEIKGEVSDCHLVKYRSNHVLVSSWNKVDKLRRKTGYIWKCAGDGKFYPVPKQQ